MTSDGDGYLRISAARTHPIRDTLAPGSELGLLFVDIAGDGSAPQFISRAIQNSPLARVRYILFRWPAVGLTDSGSEDRATEDRELAEWLRDVAEHPSLALFAPTYVGAIRFNVGDTPTITWHGPAAPDQLTERNLVDRALRVEFRALLDWGNGVWRPKQYHYILPSGTHSDVFVKLSDAFRTPHDVRVLATWLTDRLRDDMTIVADTADLIPLIIYLQNLAERRGWHAVDSEVLDEYPRTRADLATALRVNRKSEHALLLFSVNASGTYRDVMCDTARAVFQGATDWSMVVLVDKTLQPQRTGYYPGENEDITTWYGLALPPSKSPHNPNECTLCSHPARAQVVMIDPRTFEAVALPGGHLIMPDVAAARASQLLWTACSQAGAVEVLSPPAESPSTAAREKDGLMNVKIETRKLWASDDFLKTLASQLNSLPGDDPEARVQPQSEIQQADCIVVGPFDRGLPRFSEAVQLIRERFQIASSIPTVEVPDLGQPVANLGGHRRPLIVSAGSVTGWNLRQLLISVQESWVDQPMAGAVSCVVVHARPATMRQWENIASSFEGRIVAIWKSLIPETSPLRYEADLLAELPPDELSTAAKDFLTSRLKICNPPASLSWETRLARASAGDPDPRSVLWGLGSDVSQRVRNESLYGRKVDAITAYAAVGAAMQSARQNAQRSDPRWPMFDFDSISRSYYDGIIVASILRWARAKECWWGANTRDQRASISALVKRTTSQSDQVVLFPELLFAAAQGKIPRAAVDELNDLIHVLASDWPDNIERGPLALGTALVDTQVFRRSS